MDELTEARKKINEIDEQMSKLFEQRMKVSKEVAEYKIKHSLPIYDEKREQEVINKNLQYIEDNEIKEYYIDFLTEVMNISKKYQEKIIKKSK